MTEKESYEFSITSVPLVVYSAIGSSIAISSFFLNSYTVEAYHGSMKRFELASFWELFNSSTTFIWSAALIAITLGQLIAETRPFRYLMNIACAGISFFLPMSVVDYARDGMPVRDYWIGSVNLDYTSGPGLWGFGAATAVFSAAAFYHLRHEASANP